MAWSRKSAMFAALAVAMYLLGLVLRNQQLVTVAVVLLSFLTYAAFRTTHADVASSGRRLDDADADSGVALQSIVAKSQHRTWSWKMTFNFRKGRLYFVRRAGHDLLLETEAIKNA